MSKHLYDVVNELVTINCNLSRRIQRMCESQRFMFFCGKISGDSVKVARLQALLQNLDAEELKVFIDAELGNYKYWTLEDLRKKASKLGVPYYKTLDVRELITAIETTENKNES